MTLPAYAMDAATVTNAAFATFVRDTGYLTEAERFGCSAVFDLSAQAHPADILDRVPEAPWWLAVRGADWRHPFGRRSSSNDLPAPGRPRLLERRAGLLPMGRQAAAHRGRVRARRPRRPGRPSIRVGDELTAHGRWTFNIWQGTFPTDNTAEDGRVATAPVKSHRPNPYGLWNMTRAARQPAPTG